MEVAELAKKGIERAEEKLERFQKKGDLLVHKTQVQNLPRILSEGILTHKLAKRINRALPLGFAHPPKENVVSITDLWAWGHSPEYYHFKKLSSLLVLVMLDSSVRNKRLHALQAMDPGELAIGRRIKPDEILGIAINETT